ncbi:MAG: hypothetical protein IKK66_02370 [Ruminococcus sp.]|nr:hypothetical protein [Ruminococcus sp.]
MVVNYYEVKNCRYEIYDNCPVLFPPDDTAESLLREYGFVKLIDGRWCKFLSVTEYQHILHGNVNFDISYNPLKYTDSENTGNNRFSNILSILSLICFAVGIEPFLVMSFTPVFVFWGFAIALVIAARVITPKNIFAKVLSILYIIVGIIITILIIILIIACQHMCDSCINAFNDCHIPG